MLRFATSLRLLVLLSFLMPLAARGQSPGDLVVTEFMANPDAVTDATGEYVEVYNRSTASIDLNGFTLRDAGTNAHVIGASLVLAPGTFAVLARTADPVGDGSVVPDYVYSGITLGNSADEVILETGGGAVVFELTYADGDPAGAGTAMELVNIERDAADGAVTEADYQGATDPLTNGDLGSPGAFGGTVLPVEWAGFDAAVDGRAAVLTWATVSETDNAGFAVEHRRPTARAFARVAFVPGQGTTDRRTAYRHVVGALVPGTHAFRLRQVDRDGTASLSVVQTVRVTGPAPLTLRGPHPLRVGQAGRVVLTAPERQEVDVALFDVLGRRVQTVYRGPIGSVVREATLPTHRLAPGRYFLRLTGPVDGATVGVTVIGE